MTDNEITHEIIGAAIEVHKHLGPVLVEGRIVVELKSVDGLGPIHEAIILTYLRMSGRRLGLLINFNVTVLKDGVRRFMMPKESGKGPFNTEFTEVTEKNARKKD